MPESVRTGAAFFSDIPCFQWRGTSEIADYNLDSALDDAGKTLYNSYSQYKDNFFQRSGIRVCLNI